MFASRYDTYAISLYADEAERWKKHMTGQRWHDKVEGMELMLDTGKKRLGAIRDALIACVCDTYTYDAYVEYTLNIYDVHT